MIEYPVIDVWMQPGLQKFLNEPMFDSLKRWNKVLFGTNYPMISPGKCLENLADLQLPQDVSEHFLYKNAERVFKIEVS